MTGSFLGLFLLQKGTINEKQLRSAVTYQRKVNKRIGDLAVNKGLLSKKQVQQIRQEQKNLDMPFGEIAVRLDFLTPKEMKRLVANAGGYRLHLGEALLALDYISTKQYATLLPVYREIENNRRLNANYLFEGLHENRILSAVTHALEQAFSRFGDQKIKMQSIGEDLPDSEYPLVGIIVTSLPEKGTVTSHVFLEKNVAGDVLSLPPESTPEDGFLEKGRELFEIAGRYLRTSLEKSGFASAEPSLTLARGRVTTPRHESDITIRFAAPSGPVELLVSMREAE
jgi:hypothetical protein